VGGIVNVVCQIMIDCFKELAHWVTSKTGKAGRQEHWITETLN
jgi:hypothetical protein